MANQAVSTIRNLIETCRDGENGFREGAEHVTSPDVKRFFLEQSQERARFARELENALSRLGEQPDVSEKGSTAGSLHRTWINLKSSLGGGEAAILSSAEQGEDSAKQAYQDALREDLPADIDGIVRQQAQAVFAAHDRVKAMRDARKAA